MQNSLKRMDKSLEGIANLPMRIDPNRAGLLKLFDGGL
jgi:hypothetical protein